MVSINRVLIISIIFIFFLGFSQTMKDPTILYFSIKDKINLDNLSVNIYLYKRNSGSKWYGLIKKETIINHGQLIKSTASYSDISYYEIQVFTKDFIKVDFTDNIFKDSLMEYHYSFSKVKMDFKINKNKESFSSGSLYYKKDFKDSTIQKFTFYDASKEKFELTDLGPDTLAYLDSMTFKELLETDKLLNKDILKLKKLSFSQKKQLIEAHSSKNFEI